jgi:hypothetical protein
LSTSCNNVVILSSCALQGYHSQLVDKLLIAGRQQVVVEQLVISLHVELNNLAASCQPAVDNLSTKLHGNKQCEH